MLGCEGIANAAKDAQHNQLGNCHWQRPLLLAPALSGCLQIAAASGALLSGLDIPSLQRTHTHTVGGSCSLMSRGSADACAAALRPDCQNKQVQTCHARRAPHGSRAAADEGPGLCSPRTWTAALGLAASFLAASWGLGPGVKAGLAGSAFGAGGGVGGDGVGRGAGALLALGNLLAGGSAGAGMEGRCCRQGAVKLRACAGEVVSWCGQA